MFDFICGLLTINLILISLVRGDWFVVLFFLILIGGSIVFSASNNRKGDCVFKIISLFVGFCFFILSQNFFFIFFAMAPLLNALPIILNNWMMPCSPKAITKMLGRLEEVDGFGQIKGRAGYCYTGPETKLAMLGDNFYIKQLNGVLSVGDIVFILDLMYGIVYELQILEFT